MSAIACPVCTSSVCLTDTQENELRQSHRSFYCPSGHVLSFKGQSDRDRVAAAEQRAQVWKESADRAWATVQDMRENIGSCPWPECGWRSFAAHERVLKNLFRHIGKAHGIEIVVPRRLESVA